MWVDEKDMEWFFGFGFWLKSKVVKNCWLFFGVFSLVSFIGKYFKLEINFFLSQPASYRLFVLGTINYYLRYWYV